MLTSWLAALFHCTQQLQEDATYMPLHARAGVDSVTVTTPSSRLRHQSATDIAFSLAFEASKTTPSGTTTYTLVTDRPTELKVK